MPLPATNNNISLKGYELFTNGDVSVGSSIGIGDILGSLTVGFIAYLCVVIPFLIGIFSMSKYYVMQPGMNTDASNAMNYFRLALKPLLYIIIGIVVYTSFVMLIEGWYGVNVSSRLKFFLEARYDLLVGNIKVAGSMLKFANFLLFILDLFSTFVFWSIALLFLILICIIVGYILSIFLDNNEKEATVFKRVFSAAITTVIATVLVTIYYVNVSRVFFTNNANINKVGTVVSVYDGNVKVFKYWVNIGLNGKW